MAKRTKPSPIAIARKLVDNWFVRVTENMDVEGLTPDVSRIEDMFTFVQDAVLEAEGHSTDLGWVGRPIENQFNQQLDAARVAGYFVGIQIGLRLRTAGGAR